MLCESKELEIKKKLELNERNNWQYCKLLNTVQSVFLPAADNACVIASSSAARGK